MLFRSIIPDIESDTLDIIPDIPPLQPASGKAPAAIAAMAVKRIVFFMVLLLGYAPLQTRWAAGAVIFRRIS